ncbi:hypothetical protein [Cereibacter changlensis]|uniref:hypothetical protein n=1 Tax=Cereibacter changlensis TaxID=402884 RepID=UPI00147335D6|nr:hypothetical protein [Cereibacter changlensis]
MRRPNLRLIGGDHVSACGTSRSAAPLLVHAPLEWAASPAIWPKAASVSTTITTSSVVRSAASEASCRVVTVSST